MTTSIPYDVIEAIAEVEDRKPTKLTPPVGAIVDLDAMEKYLTGSDGRCWATFGYNGYVIRVSSDNVVEFAQPRSH